MDSAIRSAPEIQPPRAAPTHAPRPVEGPRDYEALLLEHLDFIERTVARLARRYALKPWDAEDLGGMVKLRLLADDYAVLRKFEGRAKLTTFLTTVIQNLFRDFRIQRWGKWRPSAAAKRGGELAIQLEALLYRDGFSEHEAFELLRDRYQVSAADEDLRAITATLRPRTTRRFEDDSRLPTLEAPDRTDRALLEGERRTTRRRAELILREVIDELDEQDRLVLKLRFVDSLTIRAIAETLDVPSRRMYTRVQRLLVLVRQNVESRGISCEEVMEIVAGRY